MQPADVVAALLRALSFISVFQAAGIALFIGVHGSLASLAPNSSAVLRAFGTRVAFGGIFLVCAHYSLEAARMAGEFGGIFDRELQRFAWGTPGGTAAIVRMAGLLIIILSLRRNTRAAQPQLVGGAALAVASFAITGHTSHQALRVLLAPLLVLHVMVIAYWFGGVSALYLIGRREPVALLVATANAFSRIAQWLAPMILVAGVLIALALLPSAAALLQPYGVLLLVKLVGYIALIGLAIRNRFWLVPALQRGAETALKPFLRTVLVEYLLLCTVLVVTAAMTGFYSPAPE